MIRSIFAALLLASAAHAQTAPQTADQRLKAVYDAEWLWRLAQTGQVQDGLDTRQGPRLPCETPTCQTARQRYWQGVLDQLASIPDAELSGEERLNKAVLAESLRAEVAAIGWRQYEMPINSDSNIWQYLPAQAPFRSELEYRNYLSRMRDLPRWFDEHVANMRAGLKRGFTPPAITLKGRDDTLAGQIKPGAESPFYAPFRAMPSSIAPDVQAALQAEAVAVINGVVNPAQTKLLTFLRTSYMPGARTSTGAKDLPDGMAYYRDQVREYTTTDMTPEAIHDLGLREVARIDADMQATMKAAGFTGDFKSFLAFLRTDPQFYARTPTELLGFSALVMKKMDGKLDQVFTTLPRKRFTLRPVPDAIAPVYTSGRGGLDACYMNTYDLKSRPLYNLVALTLHECVPGHSHQAAMALEAPARPPFRRRTYFSGYGEGWGLYTEWLGTKLGMYETPYEEFGRETFEMWRAARLVIDTGLHTQGWTRDQAIQYLEDHTALARRDIEVEVDRYISWPGQALAYKLGELKIRELRAKAETELGPRFDQRPFHDTLLGLGSVPLPVMESEMLAWIAREKAKLAVAR
ncbi:DUF885 domain-containing protein [Sandarakinorhabdus oryzae]|uniref:DUF885 domain-containing protein n=1 Tax=Sandarakinorhabdus oryzae TaxID=2675220 RepID=UPI0012E23670|nr:DUF885 family protein [Sandarakinorhabdus oryzae]